MSKKDELVSGTELAKRLKVSPPYITKKKDTLKSCKYGKKYYFRKSCLALGYDPDNLPTQKQEKKQILVNAKDILEVDKKETIEKEKPQPKTNNVPRGTYENKNIEEIKSSIDELYNEILETIADPDTTYDKLKLDGITSKAKALKEFELATAQRLKNKQLEENLYTKDEVLNIITIATAIFRNSLIDLPNNMASKLEGLTKKQIKDTTTEYINDILEDFEKTTEKFK